MRSAEKEDQWLQNMFFPDFCNMVLNLKRKKKHNFINNIILIINYLTKYTPAFHISPFTNVSCPCDKMYCHLSCGNPKHLWKEAVDSLN